MVYEYRLLMRTREIVKQNKALRYPQLEPLSGVLVGATALETLSGMMLIKADEMTFVVSHDDSELGALGSTLDNTVEYCVSNAGEVKS